MANGGGAAGGKGAAALQAPGSSAVNNLQPPVPMVYLRLSFIDPEGAVRAFPANVPVTVLYGPELSPPAGSQVYQTRANGDLRFPAWLATQCRTFTLRFNGGGQIPYFVCESLSSPPGAQACRYVTVAAGAPDPPFLSVPTAASPPASPPAQERCFSLPLDWLMIEADWYERGGGARPFTRRAALGANGNYDPTTGRVSQTVAPPADIGTAAAPVEFVLDPHWKMFQYQFFDRYYGNAGLHSPPVAGHGRRISTPPIWLEGFRTSPNATGADADTCSNWTIGGDPKDLQQCLPWILAKTNTGAALPAVTGATMGLRFRTHQTRRSFVYSQSETVREIRHVAASPPSTLAPGPDRLRYYDLPRIWKSKNYYTRNLPGSPPASEKFFQTLTTPDIQNAELIVTNTTAPRQLVFCLDDIVLTKANLVKHSLVAGQRVTLFHHKFANRRADMAPAAAWPNLSNEGVYKPDNTIANVASKGYPYSNITITVLYYITDYPDWTRLAAAQGNLFEVFDDRTPDVAANDVVGARAGVRWVDATAAPDGTAAISTVLGTNGQITPRPRLRQKPFFAMQPYFEQKFLIDYGSNSPQSAAIHHNEWTTAYAGGGRWGIGRFDLVHLRCCDWDGPDEICVLFRYLRLTVDFTTTSNDNSTPPQAKANPLAGSNATVRMTWVKGLVDNCMARWNGDDTRNTSRVWMIPRPASPPPPPLRTLVVTFFHYVLVNWSHFNIRCGDPSVTSFMGGWDGDGQIRFNATTHDASPPRFRGLAAAHELGHGLSLPDEYESNGNDSPMYAALNLLGSPYDLENRGLMHFNWWIRARYLWYAADWLRRLTGLGTINFKLSHDDSAAPGATAETNFFLPHYPHQATHPERNFVSWPVAFNFRQRTAPDTSCFDSVLYLLGNDKYSSNVLPTAVGGAARIDGLLIVLLRMQVDFTGIAGLASADRDTFFGAVTKIVGQRLNFKRTAAFQVVAGAAADPIFSRCLIHFEGCYTTVGVAGAGNSSSAQLDTDAPHHLRIVLTTGAVAVPTLGSFTPHAPPAANVLRITVPANYATNAVARTGYESNSATLIFQHACTTLGLSSALAPTVGSFQTPASYVAIVRTVMDAGTPNPVIS